MLQSRLSGHFNSSTGSAWTYIVIPERKILSNSCQDRALLLTIGFDDERGIPRGFVILVGLSFNKPLHVWNIRLGRIPFLVDFITGTTKVVIWILQRDFVFIWPRADGNWFSPDSPIRIGIWVAVGHVPQVVNIRVKVPVTGNVVK